MRLGKCERAALAFYGKCTPWHTFHKSTKRAMLSLAQKGLLEVVGDQARIREITVVINIAGQKYVKNAKFVGIGAYPYSCEAADKYPNDAVYTLLDGGGWFGLREVTFFDGVYHFQPVK